MELAELSKDELNYLFKVVQDKSAIVLDESKDYLIYNRLSPIVKEHKLDNLSKLVKEIRFNDNQILLGDVIDALTTNETLFFRDLKPFDALKNHLIPSILERKSAIKSLQIWSAACSTGQEPYSIAISLRENFPELKNWRISILATDISKEALNRAKEGVYSQVEVNRGLPIKMLVKYFENKQAKWHIKPEIKEMVTFKSLNFIEPWPVISKMDIIFLRNVLIYFNPTVKTQILTNISRQLDDEGTLFLGASESMIGLEVPFKSIITDNIRMFALKK